MPGGAAPTCFHTVESCRHQPSNSCGLIALIVQAAGTVNVRTRDNVVHNQFKVEDVKRLLSQERDSRSLTSVFGSGGSSADGEQQQEPVADG